MDAQAANAKVNEGLSTASRTLGLLSSSVTRIKSDPSKIAFSTRMQELLNILIDETASLPDYTDITRKSELFDVLCASLSGEQKANFYEQLRKMMKK